MSSLSALLAAQQPSAKHQHKPSTSEHQECPPPTMFVCGRLLRILNELVRAASRLACVSLTPILCDRLLRIIDELAHAAL
mmetsp:Transcript_7636/g.27983  ORF Transcript_7636/g.27983 Transcript_7636/m.27983 type:complete len:80 (-) Transcript_7636:265-504(-)